MKLTDSDSCMAIGRRCILWSDSLDPAFLSAKVLFFGKCRREIHEPIVKSVLCSQYLSPNCQEEHFLLFSVSFEFRVEKSFTVRDRSAPAFTSDGIFYVRSFYSESSDLIYIEAA